LLRRFVGRISRKGYCIRVWLYGMAVVCKIIGGIVMRKNGVRDIWASGGKVVNGWLGIPSSFSAEVMANADLDSLTIDMQHGIVEYQTAVTMLQGISTTNVTPLVRVPWNDPIPIMKMLDAGAYGIICPMVNTREECEKFVRACRYAPAGYRSFGPARAAIYGGADYASEANSSVITLAMIETAEAMENLEDIMSVEGLDAVYVGPTDLSISLGHAPGTKGASLEPVADNVIAAIDEILATAAKKGIKTGIQCTSGEGVRDKFQKGFDLGTITADFRLIAAGAAADVKAARS
jgi:4-hydroxy-2-oxoheptanedioate aldolase